MSIIDFLIFACGLYLVYVAVVLKTSGKITESILLPRNVHERQCKDKTSYIAYVYPRALLSGVLITIFSLFGILNDFNILVLGNFSSYYFIPLLALLIWYTYFSKKAITQFF